MDRNYSHRLWSAKNCPVVKGGGVGLEGWVQLPNDSMLKASEVASACNFNIGEVEAEESPWIWVLSGLDSEF